MLERGAETETPLTISEVSMRMGVAGLLSALLTVLNLPSAALGLDNGLGIKPQLG